MLELLLQTIWDRGILYVENDEMPSQLTGLFYRGSTGLEAIYVRRSITSAHRTCVLAEELSHSIVQDGDIRSLDSVSIAKQEAHAMGIAVEHLLPPRKLLRSLWYNDGALWRVADDLDITEKFLAYAIEYYQRKGVLPYGKST
jgi:hypothetical protein